MGAAAAQFRNGDLVQSTWSLANDPFAEPKRVNEVNGETVAAGGCFYHVSDLVLIQRPKPQARAKQQAEPEIEWIDDVPYVVEPKALVACRDLAEDCAVALDMILCDSACVVDDIPPFLVATASLVVDLI